MNYDLIIRNASIVTPGGVVSASIGISQEQIVEISPTIAGSAGEEIDATGLHAFPGLIDIHVHFNDPGRADWEGIPTGSAALSAGGGTCFFDMPLNSSPPVIDADAFDQKMQAGAGNSRTDFAFWGGLVPGNLDRLEQLADRGVVGFKAFMSNSGIADFSHSDDFTLYRGMQKAKQLGLPIAVHAENDAITTALAAESIAAGRTSPADYLDSRPAIAELEAIQRILLLAEQTGSRLHIVHISTAEGIKLVRQSKADVTCETCPHYLILNRADVEARGAIAKCAPPLRDKGENQKLWELLASGQIDLIGSDHSPAPGSMKTDKNFFKVWGGIAGVQSTLPILLDHRPPLAPDRIAAVTATTPASRFGIQRKGAIKVDYDADIALVHLAESVELKTEHLLDRNKFSPYVGRTFRGVVRQTILRGQTILKDGKIVGSPRGQFVRPTR